MQKFTINRRGFLTGAQALTAGAMLPGLLSGTTRAQNLTKMTYLTPFGYLIGFAETMYADTAGIFAKHGLDVTIEGGRGSAMAVQQVTAGNALISRTGGTDLLKAYSADPSIVAVAEIYERDLFFVISSQDNPIKTPEDMAGKTMGIVSAGGATENILDMMLAAKDMKKDDVSREVVGNAPAAFELVKQGRVSGYIATNDTVFQLKSAGEPIVAWSTDEVALCPGQVYMTSKARYDENKETIAKFLSAVYESLGALIEATDLVPIITSMSEKYDIFEAKRPDKGLAVLQNSVDNYKAVYADKLAMSEKSWESAYSLMIKAGLIDEIDGKGYYDDAARQMAFS